MDALTYLNRTTLDIIGLAGFGYSFDTLSSGTGEEASNEMDLAFRRLFSAAQAQTITNILTMLFPLLLHVVRDLDKTFLQRLDILAANTCQPANQEFDERHA
jgi:hypothetical protein